MFDPDGIEVTFEGSTDPNTPIANGWLRASHRALDPERSRPWQPVRASVKLRSAILYSPGQHLGPSAPTGAHLWPDRDGGSESIEMAPARDFLRTNTLVWVEERPLFCLRGTYNGAQHHRQRGVVAPLAPPWMTGRPLGRA